MIGPSLGAGQHRARAPRAVLLLVLFALVFFLVLLPLFGVITVLALLLNLLMVIAVMSVIGATLTMPGIAGIVLTLGMSVDANVLINERIREELRTRATAACGDRRRLRQAPRAPSATPTSPDLLAGVALFAFGTGPIKGFGVTLMIGILTSMYTAVSVSRGIATLIYGRRRKLQVDRDLTGTSHETVQPFPLRQQHRLHAAALGVADDRGAADVRASAPSCRRMRGLKGLQLRARLHRRHRRRTAASPSRPTSTTCASGLDAARLPRARRCRPRRAATTCWCGCRRAGVPPPSTGGRRARCRCRTPDNPAQGHASSDFVGPQVGKELARNGLYALCFVMIGFLVYICVPLRAEVRGRRDHRHAARRHRRGGWFAISGHEFDLTVLAGVLAVMGYSINDTIVVFDRVRENFRGMRADAGRGAERLGQPDPVAYDHHLVRRLPHACWRCTSSAAVSLRGLAESQIIGIVIGTLSSIFVACPLLLWLDVTKQDLMPKAKDEAALARRP